jgi:hypothetical protein
MDPVPYEIKEEDIDEVLSAYEPVGGGAWPEEIRMSARKHVMLHLPELDEEIRTAPEEPFEEIVDDPYRARSIRERPGDSSPDRRELALGAVEDLLIREGFIDLGVNEKRVFPATTERDTERDDG